MMTVTPLWKHVSVQNGYAFSTDEFQPSGDIPLVRIRDILGDAFETFISREAVPSENFIIRDGDLVIGMDGDFNSRIWDRGEAALNQRVCIVRPDDETDIRFVNYAMTDKLKLVNHLRYSTTVKHLSQDDIYSMRLPLPPLCTQQRLADYLDRETAEIDAAVADLDYYIKLLNQRCRHFVSEELRKDEFPAVPFFTIASITSGDGITQESIEDFGPYPVYGGNGLRGYTDSFNQSVDRILIGRQGALCGNIHHAHGPFFASEHALIVQPRRSINLVWLEHALRDLNLGRLSQASAQPGIGASEVSRQRITLPPRETQNAIAETICDELGKVHTLIAESTKLRDLLLKRRSVLITEVVTGRKQV